MKFAFFLTFTLLALSCGNTSQMTKTVNGTDSSDVYLFEGSQFIRNKDNVIEIKDDIDLLGKVWKLPKNARVLGLGGIIRNGTIVGNNNDIVSDSILFGNVTIQGEWNVSMINTNVFEDLSAVNTLKNVFALASPNVTNQIVIGQGKYLVEAKYNKDECLNVVSNTDVMLMGAIEIIPNNYESYSIVQITGSNINIKGSGTIIGDKHTHLGKDGEWGMGVKISNGSKVNISGITIKDCWGDCIYINKDSKDININNCIFDHGRRQGVSIIDAMNVTIKDCIITNVGGADPQFGIDIEPNRGDYVDNVIINNVDINNCIGGITIYGKKKDRADVQIGRVVVKNCNIHAIKKRAIKLRFCKRFDMQYCTLSSPKDVNVAYVEGVDNLTIQNNALKRNSGILSAGTNAKKNNRSVKEKTPLQILDCRYQQVGNNE